MWGWAGPGVGGVGGWGGGGGRRWEEVPGQLSADSEEEVQEMEVEVSSNTAPLRRGGWESLGGGMGCARR